MDTRERQLITEVGGDPADEDWFWFMCRGPHGPTLTWNASRQGPPGFVGIALLRRVIDERSAQDAGFLDRMRSLGRRASQSADPEVLRRAIQVLAVIGTPEDVSRLEGFTEHSTDSVARDAKAALFELKRVTLR